MKNIRHFRELEVYLLGREGSLRIFEISKGFPLEERYSLTDQIRRSSRSVTSNIAEAWARKHYIKSFVNKLTDSSGEEYETETWLEYSKDCKYLTFEKHAGLIEGYDEVRKMLISMINNPDKWCS